MSASTANGMLCASGRFNDPARGPACRSGKANVEQAQRWAARFLLAYPLIAWPATAAVAQEAPVQIQLPPLDINAAPAASGYAAQPGYKPDNADLGPLGSQSILTTPASVTPVPEDLIVDTQAPTVNDVLR